MKIWTYLEMSNKVIKDISMTDETFIDPIELAGHFNDAIDEAESEINTLPLFNYFKSFSYIPITTGNRSFPLPKDIYINKLFKIMYINGSIIYPISHIKPRYEYEDQAFSEFYGAPDDYRHQILNRTPGQIRTYFTPASRETAIIPPPYAFPDSLDPAYQGTFPNFFAPVKIWYQRSAQRMPTPTYNNIPGEPRFTESLICSLAGTNFSSVNASTDSLTTVCGLVHSDGFTPYVPGGLPYATGDTLYFSPEPGGTLPAPLVQGTPYYAIATGTVGVIKLATTLQNAQLGTAIDLTTAGVGFVSIQVVTTQTILNALYVDIPQFANFIMAWVKKLCTFKELEGARYMELKDLAEKQRKQMVDTLAEMLPDLDNEIQPDFTSYQEMS